MYHQSDVFTEYFPWIIFKSTWFLTVRNTHFWLLEFSPELLCVGARQMMKKSDLLNGGVTGGTLENGTCFSFSW